MNSSNALVVITTYLACEFTFLKIKSSKVVFNAPQARTDNQYYFYPYKSMKNKSVEINRNALLSIDIRIFTRKAMEIHWNLLKCVEIHRNK